MKQSVSIILRVRSYLAIPQAMKFHINAIFMSGERERAIHDTNDDNDNNINEVIKMLIQFKQKCSCYFTDLMG